MKISRDDARKKRKARIRKKVNGTAVRPRLVVFRSNKHIYAQIIDDQAGVTLASASTKSIEGLHLTVDNAKLVGKKVAAPYYILEALDFRYSLRFTLS